VGLGFRKLSVGQQSKEKDKLSVPNIKGCGCGQRPQMLYAVANFDSQMACRLAA